MARVEELFLGKVPPEASDAAYEAGDHCCATGPSLGQFADFINGFMAGVRYCGKAPAPRPTSNPPAAGEVTE